MAPSQASNINEPSLGSIAEQVEQIEKDKDVTKSWKVEQTWKWLKEKSWEKVENKLGKKSWNLQILTSPAV